MLKDQQWDDFWRRTSQEPITPLMKEQLFFRNNFLTENEYYSERVLKNHQHLEQHNTSSLFLKAQVALSKEYTVETYVKLFSWFEVPLLVREAKVAIFTPTITYPWQELWEKKTLLEKKGWLVCILWEWDEALYSTETYLHWLLSTVSFYNQRPLFTYVSPVRLVDTKKAKKTYGKKVA